MARRQMWLMHKQCRRDRWGPSAKEEALRDDSCISQGNPLIIPFSTLLPTPQPHAERPRYERGFTLSQVCEKSRKKLEGAGFFGHFSLTLFIDTLYWTSVSSASHLASTVAAGRIAQRESTCLTSRGSEVRNLLRPPAASFLSRVFRKPVHRHSTGNPRENLRYPQEKFQCPQVVLLPFADRNG